MPEKNDIGPGLSDFGLSAPSDASSVDGGASDLEALISGLPNAPLGDINRAEALKGRMSDVGEMEAPGHLEQLLKSPRGIAALLGTLGAGLAGGPEAAAAFGVGSVAPVLAAKGQAEAMKAAKMEELGEKLDAQEEKILRRQQMLQTAIQNAPDQFIDPETGELSVPPEVLGYLAYGMPIASNPASKRIMDRRDEAWDHQLGVLSEGLKAVSSVDDAALLLGSLDRLLDNPEPDAAQNMALARAFGTEDWDSALAGHYIREGGQSAQKALLHAAENDLPLEHPDVIRLLDFKQGAEKLPPSQRVTEEQMKLLEQVRVWESNPANAPIINQFDEEAETPEERNRLIYTAALVTAADIGLYEKFVGGQPSYVQRRLQAQYNMNVAGWNLTDTVIEARQLKDRKGMTPDDAGVARANQTVQELMADQRAVQEGERKKLMGWTSTQSGRLAGALKFNSYYSKQKVQQAYSMAERQLGEGATFEQITALAEQKISEAIANHEK